MCVFHIWFDNQKAEELWKNYKTGKMLTT